MSETPQNITLFEQVASALPEAQRAAFLQAMQRTPSTAIRLNSAKPIDTPLFDPDTYGLAPVKWCDTGRYLSSRPQFTLHPLLHAGVFYVQDPSSMIHRQVVSHILPLLSSKEEIRLLDLCAAPGGKTTAMIDALPAGSAVVANEVTPKRCAILRENLEKWGYPDVTVTSSEASAFAEAGALFDIVAVDVPCSGEGMMRKDDTACTQWNPGLVESCATLQREILKDAVEALRPGGYLIYSTCTYNTKENEENVLWLRDTLGLTPVSLPLTGTESCGSWISPMSEEETPTVWRFMPHLTEGEGLFLAVLRRPEDAEATEPKARNAKPSKPTKGKGKESRQERGRSGTPTPQDITQAAAKWVELPAGSVSELRQDADGDSLRVLPRATSRLLPYLEGRVRIMGAGVTVAQMKGRDILPAQTLAWSTALKRGAFPECDLPLDTALQYLRREALQLPDDTPKGIVLLTYMGVPLGFAKNLGNRANNLYPQNRRILHQ